jgi:peptide/nickel transport system substrate-binding protein
MSEPPQAVRRVWGVALDTLRNNDGSELHPAVRELADKALCGQADRRSVLRVLAWLGVSAVTARGVLGAAVGAGIGGQADASGAAGQGVGASGRAAGAAGQTPKSGGTLRFVCSIQQMTDPAATTWIEASNLFRNSVEFLTYVDSDNVTHPYLAESWHPSEDLKTWDFKLREGIKWSNGDPFTVADVAFNINRWIAPTSLSPNRTTFAVITGVERVDDLRFRLHLSRPVCSLPEQLYAANCPILHHKFEEQGANWPRNPIGTGPFQLTEYHVSRIAVFKRRRDYWGPPAYLDEIRYLDLGTEIATHIAALAAGQVDALYRITIGELDLVKRFPSMQLLTEPSAQTLVMRMQQDQKPYSDVRVRKAVVLSADREQMLRLAYRDQGVLGEHHHVAPFQPDYFRLPPIKRDVAQARRLLAEAGYPDGIDLTLAVGNTQGRYEQDTAQVLQQNCAEAGIRLTLQVMPAAQYWTIWDKVPFGITYWAHRPLGIMVLELAYRAHSVWNESHFNNPQFDAAINRAQGILDPHERSVAMGEAQRILQEEAIIVQAYFPKKFTVVGPHVRDFRADPQDYYRMDKVWLA